MGISLTVQRGASKTNRINLLRDIPHPAIQGRVNPPEHRVDRPSQAITRSLAMSKPRSERDMDQSVLLIDNYDSFTFNLVHYLGELGADVVVHRNDKVAA